MAQATHWNLLLPPAHYFWIVASFLGHGGVEDAGHDCIHPDAILGKFAGAFTGKADNAAARSAIRVCVYLVPFLTTELSHFLRSV